MMPHFSFQPGTENELGFDFYREMISSVLSATMRDDKMYAFNAEKPEQQISYWVILLLVLVLG